MFTVDVCVVRLDVQSHVQSTLLASLAPAERARAGRYRSPDDARRFSVARGWLRHVLGTELGIPPVDVALVGDRGKPRLAGREAPCFNLAHSGELAVIAVAADEVGIDVEAVANGRRGLDATGVACTPEESDALNRLPPGERSNAFLRLWTAKEAYLKAIGTGLAVPPDTFHVGVAVTDDPIPVQALGDLGPPRWWVRALPLGPDHVGAVATGTATFDLRIRSQWRGTSSSPTLGPDRL